MSSSSYGDLVSIILPMYNSEKYIQETIRSVENQTYNNWELIIVDDHSSDNSVSIVEKIRINDDRIRLFCQSENLGTALARNRAIAESEGRFLAFLDSDDIWKANKLEKQLTFMHRDERPFTCTYYGKIDGSGKNLHHVVKSPKVLTYWGLLLYGVGNSTVIIDRNFFGKPSVPNIKKRNDYVLWLKIIKKSSTIYCLRQELSFHRLRQGSLSSHKVELLKYNWLVYRKYENLSLLSSLFIIGFVSFRSIRNILATKLFSMSQDKG